MNTEQKLRDALRDCVASLGGINSDSVPESAKQALAEPAQPAPLVRLTDDDVREIANREFVQTNHSWESKVFKFADTIMDAMQAKNGGA